jgi:hypothetical protein
VVLDEGQLFKVELYLSKQGFRHEITEGIARWWILGWDRFRGGSSAGIGLGLTRSMDQNRSLSALRDSSREETTSVGCQTGLQRIRGLPFKIWGNPLFGVIDCLRENKHDLEVVGVN